MGDAYKAEKISDNVYWVGAVDWSIRDFHGYATGRGSSYNAFLIMGEKITLIDAVKAPYYDELITRISSVIDPSKIDYVVSNHAEMDHSGCLNKLVNLVKPEKLFASPNGKKALMQHFHEPMDITAIEDCKPIDLGNMKLVPIITPMLHWPDSMMTYLDVDGVLFSQDGFGMHLASTERFADELPADGVWYETKKYFANILTPFGLQIKKTLQRIQSLDIDIKIIANDHGPLWRGELINKVIGKYIQWCDQKPEKKAVITYASMWKSTETMARAVASGVWSKGVSVKLEPLGSTHRSDIMAELLEAGAFVIGTPTLNNQMFPTVADFLCYMSGLKPKNLVGATFGSYGWSGQAPKIAAGILESMKLDMLEDPLRHIYVPDQDALDNCYALGERIGQAVLDKCKEN